MDAQGFYDGLGSDYDLMVSWEQRLAREQEFFRRVFSEAGVKRVLDSACGTGMHAVSFAREGWDCTAADLSRVMVEKARENARRAGVQVRFEAAGFGELSTRVGVGFDAVTCIGNSLPHLLDDASLHACLVDFSALLVPGGTLVIQNRNYDRLLRERQRFMPPVCRAEEDGEALFLRITEFPAPGTRGDPADARHDEAVSFTIVTLRKRGGEWTQTERTTPLRALRCATLKAALDRAGFGSVRVYGSYAFEPFDSPGTADLVVIARR
jgi:glycine/sarcosine N-methyltransferase